jgi:BirA family transcriptional regulator, biotin operon repressor / biotin---[acetyl-CoA-carboxylase] ligase
MADALPADFAEALSRSVERRGPFGAGIVYLRETPSTNDAAAALAQAGAQEGTIVLASTQTAGRGRLGRRWFSPSGAGLYMSIVCRARATASFLTLAGGVAAADGITKATALPVEIKWPNDVVCRAAGGDRPRKLAGVLAEGSSGPDGLEYVVVGIGINLRAASYPPELADCATAIETELGRPVDRGAVLSEVLSAFAYHVTHVAAHGPARLLGRWRELAPSAMGTRVECDVGGLRESGVAAGIAEDGALLVRIGSRLERVISGEVFWNGNPPSPAR